MGNLQTTFAEVYCLQPSCGIRLRTDIKHGGIRYAFCPDCKHWSVFQPKSVTDAMKAVEEKRYGIVHEGAPEQSAGTEEEVAE